MKLGTTLVDIDKAVLFVYSEVHEEEAFISAVVDARDARRKIGTSGGVLALYFPWEKSFRNKVAFELWPHRPPVDYHGWDDVYEADVLLTERVYLQPGGGTAVERPWSKPGPYRLLISGGDYDPVMDGERDGVTLRFQLWPRECDEAPEVWRVWPRWKDYG